MMNTYSVRKYFVVEVLVEAEDAQDALAFAVDYDYTVDTSYLRFAGGPEIQAADIDDEVILVEVQS
jgi:hypothetical protein